MPGVCIPLSWTKEWGDLQDTSMLHGVLLHFSRQEKTLFQMLKKSLRVVFLKN